MSTYDRIRSKKGAALAIVIMVGLVIIVLSVGLIPLVLASQTTVNNSYTRREDYIQARSSLEFAKASLYDTVINGNSMPSDFYVLHSQAGDYITTSNPTEFTAAQAGSLTVEGTQYFSSAFCDVDTENAVYSREGTRYDISVTTLGSKAYTFNTYCIIPNTSMTIIPATYLNRKAAPLSNFVVVDGEYGGTELWKYAAAIKVTEGPEINDGSGEHLYDTAFTDISESLLRITDNPVNEHISDYPVALKSTVTPAEISEDEYNEVILGSPDERPEEYEGYVYPESINVSKKELTDEIIAVKINCAEATGAVSYDASLGALNSGSKVLYNGSETKPTAIGKYTVVLDFAGSDIYTARSGITLGTYEILPTIPDYSAYFSISNINVNSCTVEKDRDFDVAFSGIGAMHYGYSLSEEPSKNDIIWQSAADNELKGLPTDTTVYIWVCNESNDNYASSRVCIGSFYTLSTSTYGERKNRIENGKQYLIIAQSGSYYGTYYYAMTVSGNSLNSARITDDSIINILGGTSDRIDVGDNYKWYVETAGNVSSIQSVSNERFLRNSNSNLVLNNTNTKLWRYNTNNYLYTNNRYLYYDGSKFTASQWNSSTLWFIELSERDEIATERTAERTFPEDGIPVITNLPEELTPENVLGIIGSVFTDGSCEYTVESLQINGVEYRDGDTVPKNPGTYAVYAQLSRKQTVDGTEHEILYKNVRIGEYSIDKIKVSAIPSITVSPTAIWGIETTAALYEMAAETGKSATEILEEMTKVGISASVTFKDEADPSLELSPVGTLLYGFKSNGDYGWYDSSPEISGLSLGTDYKVRVKCYGTWQYEIVYTAPPETPTEDSARLEESDDFGNSFLSATQDFRTPEKISVTVDDFDFDESYSGISFSDVIITEAPAGLVAGAVILSYSADGETNWISHDMLVEREDGYSVRLELKEDFEFNRFYKNPSPAIEFPDTKKYKVSMASVSEHVAATDGKYYGASFIAAPSVYFAYSGRTEAALAETETDKMSIATKGTNTLIYANLVSFSAGIDDSDAGGIYLYSYNSRFPDKLTTEQLSDYANSVLVFFYQNCRISNGSVFSGGSFYLFPNGTNLCAVTSPSSFYAGKTLTELEEENNSIIQWSSLGSTMRPYFENGTMPEIELDIAYATQPQIEKIISGESAKWNTDGKFTENGFTAYCNIPDNIEGDGSKASLEDFTICLFTNGFSADITSAELRYTANRIMYESGSEFTVTNSVGFETRYLSLGCSTLSQAASSPSFKVYTLALRHTDSQINADTVSLEVDFEYESSTVRSIAAEYAVPKGIYSYANGTDLFGGDSGIFMPSQTINFTNYSTDYVNAYAAAAEGRAGQGVIYCDKYIKITNDAELYPDLETTQLYFNPLADDGSDSSRSLRIYFYTSLLYLDVEQINCTESGIHDVYIYVAPQEAAYSGEKALSSDYTSGEVFHNDAVLIYVNSADGALRYYNPAFKLTPNYPYYDGTVERISHDYSVATKYNSISAYNRGGYGPSPIVGSDTMNKGTFGTNYPASPLAITDATIAPERGNQPYIDIPNGLYLVEHDECYALSVGGGGSSETLLEVRSFSLGMLACNPSYYRLTDKAIAASYGIRLDDHGNVLGTVFLDYDLTNSYGATTASFGNGTVS